MAVQNIVWHPSANFGPRREGAKPSLIVLHYTAMPSAQDALDRLCDPVHEVSAHYLIAGSGTITQMVAERDRAWHAGKGAWRGVEDVNSHSIGIELDNPGSVPFPDAQMEALEGLLLDVMIRNAIPAKNVIGHSDMAPGRKFDPGPWFDWERLARKGLAISVECSAQQDVVSWDDFISAAKAAGYPVTLPRQHLLMSVRLRAGLTPYFGEQPEIRDIIALNSLS